MKSRIQISLVGIGSSLIITSILIGLGFGYSNSVDSVSEVYNNKTMVLGNNVKNLVVLIPNEGYESPSVLKEHRLINQPYVPQNIVASPGTNIIWFNGDVGHSSG